MKCTRKVAKKRHWENNGNRKLSDIYRHFIGHSKAKRQWWGMLDWTKVSHKTWRCCCRQVTTWAEKLAGRGFKIKQELQSERLTNGKVNQNICPTDQRSALARIAIYRKLTGYSDQWTTHIPIKYPVLLLVKRSQVRLSINATAHTWLSESRDVRHLDHHYLALIYFLERVCKARSSENPNSNTGMTTGHHYHIWFRWTDRGRTNDYIYTTIQCIWGPYDI